MLIEVVISLVLPWFLAGSQRLLNNSMRRMAPLVRQESYSNLLVRPGNFQLHRQGELAPNVCHISMRAMCMWWLACRSTASGLDFNLCGSH